jgi:sarcosine oxidase
MTAGGGARPDVIVIGLGAIGSATLYQLARKGIRAVGIDRYRPPHDLGSSHGETRITRLAVGEGDDYAPLVRRSHAIWRDLEEATGTSLLHQVGGLIIGARHGTPHHGKADFFERTVAVAERHAIAHEVLSAAEMGYRFSSLELKGDERGYYEPEAGMLFPERCIRAQLAMAECLGATLRLNEAVLSVSADSASVSVTTSAGRLEASRVVMAAGPWLPALAPASFAASLKVFRQTLHWFPAPPVSYDPGQFPIFLWMHGEAQEDYFYGFPQLPGSGSIKVASERYALTTTPDACDRAVSAAESAEVFARHVNGRLRGIGAQPLRAAACLYTVTPDAGFLVDTVPELPGVLLASACSGHGFKHSAALGETIACSILDDFDAKDALAPFSMHRFLHGSFCKETAD